MKPKIPALTAAVAIGAIAFGAWAAAPDTGKPGTDTPRRHWHHDKRPMSVERIAMRNLIVAQLAQRSGKSEADVATLLDEQGPRGVAETLKLDRDAMRDIFKSARLQFIDQAAQAQMITADQAETLRNAKLPDRPRGGAGDGDRRDGRGKPRCDGQGPMPPEDDND